ncbi:MAG: DEAD/DEAH box helicase family protein [Acetobacter sp.]|nr:DEAD/DEAH box helicase family protein [Acetobacter sp.]
MFLSDFDSYADSRSETCSDSHANRGSKPSLKDYPWEIKYTPEQGNLVEKLYLPLLHCAQRYDRLTGYFNAKALSLAARGVEALVYNKGYMRLIVGCTLEENEIEAIQKGLQESQTLNSFLEERFARIQQEAASLNTLSDLELLAWLVKNGFLEIKIAIPCNKTTGKPTMGHAIFHEKSGIVEDTYQNSVAFTGSMNETGNGWTGNWESLHMFTSWEDEKRVDHEIKNFVELWMDRSQCCKTVTIPTAVREKLFTYLPRDNALPERLKNSPDEKANRHTLSDEKTPEQRINLPFQNPLRAVWAFIQHAPRKKGGDRVGALTSTVKPWPHQRRAFCRLYHDRSYEEHPPKLLIADEVGLGKTIQAGLLLRQAWLAGRARRILVLAPSAVCKQWQIELREKFNLNWPIYDGKNLEWYESPYKKACQEGHKKKVSQQSWLCEDQVIVSSHLIRRKDRAKEFFNFLETTQQEWDIVVLDEAHHARRRGASGKKNRGPNALLKFMQRLKNRTKGLVLLTATPMQVAPVEVYDLLALLGMPSEWDEGNFLQFFNDVDQENPSDERFNNLVRLFQAAQKDRQKHDGKTLTLDDVLKTMKRLGEGESSIIKAKRILGALTDQDNLRRNSLDEKERRIACDLMKRHTPIAYLISRNTRALLRRYHQEGKLTTPIASRNVEDRFITLSEKERLIYEEVEAYISKIYNQAKKQSAKERSSVGFVMTIYRKRLASSFAALRQTLETRLEEIRNPQGRLKAEPDCLEGIDEESVDDYFEGEIDEKEIDNDKVRDLIKDVLCLEEQSKIEELIRHIDNLALMDRKDTKFIQLKEELRTLKADGYKQVMVFTQFTDTMDFLRQELAQEPDLKIMCFSGRGGEIMQADGKGWKSISRDEVKQRFREEEADILLCTDAAAEGLNFQFCGALINYDMPWNPMRVEQRIGRVDRLGQEFQMIRIINLHYADTVEADVYKALRDRIKLFENVVGGLQPILSNLSKRIADQILEGCQVKDLPDQIKGDIETLESNKPFDIDQTTEDSLNDFLQEEEEKILTMEDLERIIRHKALLPPEVSIEPMGEREYKFSEPGLKAVRVTTDPNYYKEHAESVELWSPGNPTFPNFPPFDETETPEEFTKLADVLDQILKHLP